MPRANWSFIGNCAIPIFEFDEQERIADYLDNTCTKIDKLISMKQEQILALQNTRSQLISDVMIGRIDIRNIIVPNFEYIEEAFEDNTDETDDDAPEEE